MQRSLQGAPANRAWPIIFARVKVSWSKGAVSPHGQVSPDPLKLSARLKRQRHVEVEGRLRPKPYTPSHKHEILPGKREHGAYEHMIRTAQGGVEGARSDLARYALGSLSVRSRYAFGTIRYARGARSARFRYALGTHSERSRYSFGTLSVRSRYALRTPFVRFLCALCTPLYAICTPFVRVGTRTECRLHLVKKRLVARSQENQLPVCAIRSAGNQQRLAVAPRAQIEGIEEHKSKGQKSANRRDRRAQIEGIEERKSRGWTKER